MPSNEERAAHGSTAVEAYRDAVRDCEDDTVLIDLLTDLRHWARRSGHDFANAVRLSQIHFEEESGE